jgi:Cu-Zn family superoxide dismutase
MNRTTALASLLPLSLLVACGSAPASPSTPAVPAASSVSSAVPAASGAPGAPAAAESLTVPIEARSGSKLSGTATFTPVEGGVKVVIKIAGAPPGKVATHVHEKGDCSAPDATSAGGHFNPGGHKHGLPDGERHLGDLGNIEVKADGTGVHEIVVKGANLLPGDASSFLDKAIIVHEKLDDGGQPTGNAGGRIGCGVIKR